MKKFCIFLLSAIALAQLPRTTIGGSSGSGISSYQMALIFGGASGISLSATNFIAQPGANPSITETARQLGAPVTGTITLLQCATASAQPSTGALDVNLRINEADASPAVAFTLAANSPAGIYSSGPVSVAVTAGNRLSVRGVNAATSVSPILYCTVTIQAS